MKISGLRRKIVHKHPTVGVSRDVNSRSIDAIVTMDFVHKLSNEIHIVITGEKVASSAKIQFVATLVAERGCVLSTGFSNPSISNVP
jgi:hypothetical protein